MGGSGAGGAAKTIGICEGGAGGADTTGIEEGTDGEMDGGGCKARGGCKHMTGGKYG